MWRDLLFEPFRHERFAAAADFVDVFAEEAVGLVLGAAEDEALVGFGGDHSGQHAAVAQPDGVVEKLRRHLAVGIEDVNQNLLRRAMLHRL